MKVEELKQLLSEKGFSEEEKDTGWEYKKEEKGVKLLCYIEPHIEVQFIAIYKWHEDDNDNSVKGIYNISIDKLRLEKESVSTLFKRTLTDMPERIGDRANAHSEVKAVIDEVFGENTTMI